MYVLYMYNKVCIYLCQDFYISFLNKMKESHSLRKLSISLIHLIRIMHMHAMVKKIAFLEHWNCSSSHTYSTHTYFRINQILYVGLALSDTCNVCKYIKSPAVQSPLTCVHMKFSSAQTTELILNTFKILLFIYFWKNIILSKFSPVRLFDFIL